MPDGFASEIRRRTLRLRLATSCILFTSVLAFLQASPSFSQQFIRFSNIPHDRLESRLRQYAGSDQQRKAKLMEMFADAGCDQNHLTEQAVKGSKLPNVICTLPGSSERAIIVGAHYDHVAAGDGVVDNWSGASLLPSLFESLKSQPRTHTYIFIGFASEEVGEIGSAFYAKHMSKEQIAETDAMVNMDTLGLAPTEVWVSHSDKALTADLAQVAHLLKVPLSGVNVEYVGSTDSEQFAARKIPSITVHSLTQEALNQRILHTPKDQFSAIKLDDYYQTCYMVMAYLAYLDQVLSPPARAGTK